MAAINFNVMGPICFLLNTCLTISGPPPYLCVRKRIEREEERGREKRRGEGEEREEREKSRERREESGERSERRERGGGS